MRFQITPASPHIRNVIEAGSHSGGVAAQAPVLIFVLVSSVILLKRENALPGTAGGIQ